MDELIKAIIYLLSGIAVLLCGMKLMSNGLKKAVGSGIKVFFKKTNNRPIVSLGIGAGVTAVIQSSDATNAMVIGFINAGVMTVYQGLCIMLGAYIGTTMTGILASFSSLSFSVYLLSFSFIGTVMMFLKNEKVKNIGEMLCGLGMLFFALSVMKESFANADIHAFCVSLFSSIDFGALLFLVGVVMAALVQSSSAVTSIVIAMVGAQALSLDNGLFIVLGAMLGTVTNTLLSSIGGKIEGKRAAWTAFAIRLITTVVTMVVLMFFHGPISSFFHLFAIGGSDELPVALFTVVYNVILMPLMIPFLKPIIAFFDKSIKDKGADELAKSVHFIDDKLLGTPIIALHQVKQEIVNMFDLSYENYMNGYRKVVLKDDSRDKELVELEEKVDYLNRRITDFLVSLSNKVSDKDEKKVGAYFHVINDIERIGDHAYNFFEMANSMRSEELSFSKDAVKELSEMHFIINKMFVMSRDIFLSRSPEHLSELHALEKKTDELKTLFYTNHYERIKNQKCTSELTPFISSLIVELERVADHLTNIGYSVVNPTGDE